MFNRHLAYKIVNQGHLGVLNIKLYYYTFQLRQLVTLMQNA